MDNQHVARKYWKANNDKLIIIRICLFIFLFYGSIAQAALNPTETLMRENVLKLKQEQLTLLQQLVDINSGTTNISGVYRTGEIVRNQLERLGFKTKWLQEPTIMHKAPTLVAEHEGKEGSRILLIGHLDTVFAPDSTFKLFEIKKNRAIGPGILDAKGGIVVMLYALKALQAAHQLDNKTITVVLTGDEENSGKPTSISRKPLFAAAEKSDVALDFEPSITLGTATIARRGISQWTIAVNGHEAHSATIFSKDTGLGAIFEIARILNTMRLQLRSEKSLSFNPGIILGGTKVEFDNETSQGIIFGKENVVAKSALAKGDLRFINSTQRQAIENKIRAIVKDNLPGTSATVTFQEGIPAMEATQKNLQLLEKYSSVSMDLGEGAVKPFPADIRGAGDISHVANIVSANLSGLGPTGIGSHSISEAIDLASLPQQTVRAAILMYRLTR